MPIAIKLTNNKVPPKCMEILMAFAKHKDECLNCTMAQMNKKAFECYCIDGQKLLTELAEQPEVKRVE